MSSILPGRIYHGCLSIVSSFGIEQRVENIYVWTYTFVPSIVESRYASVKSNPKCKGPSKDRRHVDACILVKTRWLFGTELLLTVSLEKCVIKSGRKLQQGLG
jgi:hypothetical protein